MLFLAAYVVLLPPFVLGPLAGLLAASGPRSWREWLWILPACLWLAAALATPGGLAEEMVGAWGLFLTAGFVVTMISGRRSVISGALLAAIFAFLAATAWAWAAGTEWRDVQFAATDLARHRYRELTAPAGLGGAGDSTAQVLSFGATREAFDASAALLGDLYPGLLTLLALPGLSLAWRWYHRLAANPVGSPAGPFREFRFSDQLVWLVVGLLGALLLPLPAPVHAMAGNVGLVVGGLYAARGLAVLWGPIEDFPTPVLVLMALGSLIFLPIILGGCFALGLADTWVDFRRRFAVPSP